MTQDTSFFSQYSLKVKHRKKKYSSRKMQYKKIVHLALIELNCLIKENHRRCLGKEHNKTKYTVFRVSKALWNRQMKRELMIFTIHHTTDKAITGPCCIHEFRRRNRFRCPDQKPSPNMLFNIVDARTA